MLHPNCDRYRDVTCVGAESEEMSLVSELMSGVTGARAGDMRHGDIYLVDHYCTAHHKVSNSKFVTFDPTFL